MLFLRHTLTRTTPAPNILMVVLVSPLFNLLNCISLQAPAVSIQGGEVEAGSPIQERKQFFLKKSFNVCEILTTGVFSMCVW